MKTIRKGFSQIRYYNTKIIDHYENPRNVGSFPKNYKNIGTGLVGAPACGDVMKLEIQVENDVIVDAKFKTYGCGSAIASSSYTTEHIKGKTLKEVKHFTNREIADHLKLPPIKLHCSMLAEDALQKAVSNYRNKKNE
jgi:Fe-S cluster assembly scaffold IscU